MRLQLNANVMHTGNGRCRFPGMATSLRFPEDVVHSDPERLGGTPVFVGSRVPVQSLFDYLEAGDSLEEFLHQFPSVRREQAVAALEYARDQVMAGARPS